MIPHEPPAPLLRWHAWARSRPWLGRFTLANRLLLAMAFLPTGMVKATGQRFTLLPVENPVGFFFEAMYRTGPYWYFIGLVQVAAAICLLVPPTATLGAVLFFPVIVSIVLITWGVGFGGTAYVTSAMLLSVVYLLCWDGDRLWKAASHILGTSRGPGLLAGGSALEWAGWLLGATAGMGLVLITRGFLPRELTLTLLGAGGVAALMVVASWVVSAVKGGEAGR